MLNRLGKMGGLGALTYGGRTYNHGDPVYGASGVFLGNYIDGMTSADMDALFGYEPQQIQNYQAMSYGGGTTGVPLTPAPAPAPSSGASWGPSASPAPAPAYSPAPAPAYSPAPAPAPSQATSRVDEIRAVLNPIAGTWAQAQANADQIYEFIAQNSVSYAELQQAMGWSAAQVDTLLVRGAQILGITGGQGNGVVNAGAGGGSETGDVSQSFQSGGAVEFDEGSMDPAGNMSPIVMGAIAIGAILLLRGGDNKRRPRRATTRNRSTVARRSKRK